MLGIAVRIDRVIYRIEVEVCMLFLAVIVVVLGLNVFLRYTFSSPLAWIPDLSTLLLIWITFVGASAFYKNQGHIAIQAFVSLLSPSVRLGFGCFVAAIIGLIVFITGSIALQAIQVQKNQLITALGLPRSFFSFPIVWASISMFLTSCIRVLLFFRSKRNPIN
jgi:TRAP-type C4-dicarboxylate transport system permease small subunit